MSKQCECTTVTGRRCRRPGLEYRRVRLQGTIQEVLVCDLHVNTIYHGYFRRASDGARQERAA